MALPAGYVGLFNILSECAKENGYALALHGSLKRDMDIMAMPWTARAIAPEDLIQKLHDAITFLKLNVMMDDQFHDNPPTFPRRRIDGPELKPHGRLAWNIQLGGGCFLDISVMPRDIDRPGVTPKADARAIPYPLSQTSGPAPEMMHGVIHSAWPVSHGPSAFLIEPTRQALYRQLRQMIDHEVPLPGLEELVVYHWAPGQRYAYGLVRQTESRQAQLDPRNAVASLTHAPLGMEALEWPWEILPV